MRLELSKYGSHLMSSVTITSYSYSNFHKNVFRKKIVVQRNSQCPVDHFGSSAKYV